MKKKVIVYSSGIIIISMLLTGCRAKVKILSEKIQEVENVSFKNDNRFWGEPKKVEIETKDNYYLISGLDIKYKKTDNLNSFLKIRKVKTSYPLIGEVNSIKYVLNIADKDLKNYSQNYIQEFIDNIPINN